MAGLARLPPSGGSGSEGSPRDPDVRATRRRGRGDLAARRGACPQLRAGADRAHLDRVPTVGDLEGREGRRAVFLQLRLLRVLIR